MEKHSEETEIRKQQATMQVLSTSIKKSCNNSAFIFLGINADSMKGLTLLKIKCTLCSLFKEQAPFLEQEEYCKCFQERRRSSQPFSSLRKRMPLCLQGTASHVTIKNNGVLAPITGVQAKVWRHPCPAPFEEHTAGFQRDMDLSLTLDSPSHHHIHAVLPKPAGWVTRTAVLLGRWCNTDSCPKECWVQLIRCRRQSKQRAAASWKLCAAAVGWSSSTAWAGGLYLLISYPSF